MTFQQRAIARLHVAADRDAGAPAIELRRCIVCDRTLPLRSFEAGRHICIVCGLPESARARNRRRR